jgi:hypothetical protein
MTAVIAFVTLPRLQQLDLLQTIFLGFSLLLSAAHNRKSHDTQAFDSHAQLLRLPQQLDQHKSTCLAIMGDVFTL